MTNKNFRSKLEYINTAHETAKSELSLLYAKENKLFKFEVGDIITKDGYIMKITDLTTYTLDSDIPKPAYVGLLCNEDLTVREGESTYAMAHTSGILKIKL